MQFYIQIFYPHIPAFPGFRDIYIIKIGDANSSDGIGCGLEIHAVSLHFPG